MMRKLLSALLAVFFVVSSFTSFATVSPEDVTIAVYPNEPLLYTDENGTQGFLVDLLNEVAAEENWNITYKDYLFTDAYEAVKNEEVDFLLGTAWAKQRADELSYNKEALFVNWGQIYANPKINIESFEDLSGMKIGVYRNDIHYTGEGGLKNTLDQFGIGVVYFEYDDKINILRDIESGMLDAGIVNRTFGMINEENYNIKKVSIQLNPVKLHVVAPAGQNLDKLQIIDGYIKSWKADDNSIYHNRMMFWFEATVQEKIPTWIWIILVGFAGLLAISSIVIYVTQRIIHKQTSELKDLNHSLEEKVEERTIDLDASNQQLKVSLITLEEKQSELEEMNAILEEQVDVIERAQNQLIEAEKMASLGQMVASLAHELNTPLGVCVTLYSNVKLETKRQIDALGKNTLTKHSLTEYLSDMNSVSEMFHNNIDSVVDLVDRFKMLSSDRIFMNERKINMHEYLHMQMDSLSPELKNSDHNYKIDCPNDLNVVVDPSALSQVIRNLTMNSLIHGFEDVSSGEINIHVQRRQDRVLIEYKDDGKGVRNDIKSHMFEPFFTTKRNKGGTGLGLAIVHSAVTQSLDGEIRVDEREKNGLKYEIELPFREIETPNFSVPNIGFQVKGIHNKAE